MGPCGNPFDKANSHGGPSSSTAGAARPGSPDRRQLSAPNLAIPYISLHGPIGAWPPTDVITMYLARQVDALGSEAR